MQILQIVAGLILMVLIMYLAYRFSRMLAVRTSGRFKGRYLREADRMAMGPEQYIALVRAGKGYYLVGVTKQNISVLAEIPEEELAEIPAGDGDLQGTSVMQSEFLKKFRTRTDELKDRFSKHSGSGRGDGEQG